MSKIRKEVKRSLVLLALCIIAFMVGYAVAHTDKINADGYTMNLINTTGVSCADVLYEGCL